MNLTSLHKPRSKQIKGKNYYFDKTCMFLKLLIQITLKNICYKDIYLRAETMLLTFMKYPVIFFRDLIIPFVLLTY